MARTSRRSPKKKRASPSRRSKSSPRQRRRASRSSRQRHTHFRAEEALLQYVTDEESQQLLNNYIDRIHSAISKIEASRAALQAKDSLQNNVSPNVDVEAINVDLPQEDFQKAFQRDRQVNSYITWFEENQGELANNDVKELNRLCEQYALNKTEENAKLVLDKITGIYFKDLQT